MPPTDRMRSQKRHGWLAFTTIWALTCFVQSSQAAEIPNAAVELQSAAARIRVTPVARGLRNPFALAFRGNGDILVTERYRGRLRLIAQDQLQPVPIAGTPTVFGDVFRAGLMAVAVHPENDALIYLTYTKPIQVDGQAEQTVALARGLLIGNELHDVRDLLVARGLDRGIAAAKLLFTPDNKLLMSVGGAYVYAGYGHYGQDPTVHFGKLLRLNDDGSVPDDNPFVESGEYLPEVYTVGHRNQIGLAWHPLTGELWASENGPQGGDEINIIEAGKNYGWPVVSLSRQYRGDWVSSQHWSESYVNPEVVWWPSIAPSGMVFYTGDRIPEWQGNLLVGSLMQGRIPDTGHLERLVFNSRGEEIRRESLLREFKSRVSDVQQGPDGFLYVLLDEEDGALLRLESIPQTD